MKKSEIYDRNNYNIDSLEDEIRADALCDRLLKECYLHLVDHHQLSAEEASRLCYGVSYFLREYIIPDRRANLFDITALQIRQFAGNWYIIKNMEPNLAELAAVLEGVFAFYDFLLNRKLIPAEVEQEVRKSCADLDYYRERIDSFYAIENDGYFSWDAACPLKN